MHSKLATIKVKSIYLSESNIPIRGNSTMGIIAVTGSGRASDTQYPAIRNTTYIHLKACNK